MKYLLILTLLALSVISYGQLALSNAANYSYKLTVMNDTSFEGGGTGVIILYKKQFFLITNYHVITAKDPNTDSIMSLNGENPTTILIRFRHTDSTYRNSMYHLYDSKNRPLFSTFYAFNTGESKLDFAILPLTAVSDGAMVFCIKETDIDTSSMVPNKNVYIVGYPKGHLTSYTARTLHINAPQYYKDHLIFINNKTDHGASGSPVFLSEKNGLKLIGILSMGLINSKEYPKVKGAAISIKYVTQLLDEMIKNHNR